MMGANIREKSIVKYPNLFDTIELSRDDKLITMSNPLYMNRLARLNEGQTVLSDKQKYRKSVIKNDLTVAGAITHARILNVDVREFVRKYTEKMNDFAHIESSYSYPDDYIKMYEDMGTLVDEDHDEFDLEMDCEPEKKRQKIK